MSGPTTMVYVSCDTNQEIIQFRMDDSGALARCGATALPRGDGGAVPPVTELKSLRSTGAPLAASPDGQFLYAAVRTTPFRIASYKVDPEDGALTHFGEVPLPASTPFIDTDRSGRYLLGAAYNGNMLWVCEVDRHRGGNSSLLQAIEGIVTPHFILLHPDNRIAYVAATGHREIQVYDFDEASGTLTDVRSTPFPASSDATPRHLGLHPANPWLYAINETSGTVDGFRIADGTGALTHFQRIEAGFPEELSDPLLGADLHLSPDGRLLFASERRHGKISVFTIDARSGELSLTQRVPAGDIPRSFQIDPSGRFLIAAGQATQHITVFSIDGEAGRLKPLATYEAGARPTWVEIVTLAGMPQT